jgi:2,3-bisphosphoglycerate-dependent phosphoglycerate mutase
MQLEHLSPDSVMQVELATGVPIIYEINASGQVTDKVILNH